MTSLQVQVFANEKNLRDNRRLFERVVQVPDDSTILYAEIVKSLRFLYGEHVIINFSLYLL